MRNFIKEALQQAARNMQMTKSGLVVPAPYVKGLHYGGFDGYEEWIQECIMKSCHEARGVMPDELSEITAFALWAAPGDVTVVYEKHSRVLELIDRCVEAFADKLGLQVRGVDPKEKEQIRRADGLRQTGTLLVVAGRVVDEDDHELLYKKFKLSTSAWHPASMEEAEAVPTRRYLLG